MLFCDLDNLSSAAMYSRPSNPHGRGAKERSGRPYLEQSVHRPSGKRNPGQDAGAPDPKEELRSDGVSVRLSLSEHAQRWERGDEEEDELSTHSSPAPAFKNPPPQAQPQGGAPPEASRRIYVALL